MAPSGGALIEGSKVFAKILMKKYGIPTAKYEVFDDPGKVAGIYSGRTVSRRSLRLMDWRWAKALVLLPRIWKRPKRPFRAIMEDKIFGKSGNQVVVEEFLTGKEVSVLAFTDSHTVSPMVSSMDHKRAFDDNDEGPNTGGMGTIAPSPYYTADVAKRCMEEIFLPTVEAMKKEGCPFKGCLYFGMILTPNGPKVIEYNCRFGDPETQVVLPSGRMAGLSLRAAGCWGDSLWPTPWRRRWKRHMKRWGHSF